MTVTNESGGRLNAFANEPQIDVITAGASNYSSLKFFAFIAVFTLISIIGIYFII